jgi:hypothetical protein
VTDFAKADAKAALARLEEERKAIIVTRPAQLASILDGSLEECARLAAENAELRERIRAARQDVFPLLRTTGLIGELARNVEAALDPHPEVTS